MNVNAKGKPIFVILYTYIGRNTAKLRSHIADQIQYFSKTTSNLYPEWVNAEQLSSGLKPLLCQLCMQIIFCNYPLIINYCINTSILLICLVLSGLYGSCEICVVWIRVELYSSYWLFVGSPYLQSKQARITSARCHWWNLLLHMPQNPAHPAQLVT